MATPPKKRPDRHYNFTTTNMVFAWSSLALLAVTAWMVVDDYNKPWKRFQSEFRDRERQVLAAAAEEERQGLNQNEIARVEQEVVANGALLASGQDDAKEPEGDDQCSECARGREPGAHGRAFTCRLRAAR